MKCEFFLSYRELKTTVNNFMLKGELQSLYAVENGKAANKSTSGCSPRAQRFRNNTKLNKIILKVTLKSRENN